MTHSETWRYQPNTTTVTSFVHNPLFSTSRGASQSAWRRCWRQRAIVLSHQLTLLNKAPRQRAQSIVMLNKSLQYDKVKGADVCTIRPVSTVTTEQLRVTRRSGDRWIPSERPSVPYGYHGNEFMHFTEFI